MVWACGAHDTESSEGSSTETETSVERVPEHPGDIKAGHNRTSVVRFAQEVNLRQRRRAARPAAVDRDLLTVSAVTQHVNDIGVGKYQWFVLMGVGASLLAESMDMSAVSSLHAALGRAFMLTEHERAWLTFFTYMGSGFAVLFAGPLTDFLGRKLAVVASVFSIALSFLALALLPEGSNFGILVLLRALSGSAAGVGGMAGPVLAVESCPSEARSRYMFGIQFVASCGYLFGAAIIANIMPGFGEKDTDNWRLFCVILGLAPLMSLPFLYCINESPLFLAVRGNLVGAIEVLRNMAQMNGKPEPPHVHLPQKRVEEETRSLMEPFPDRMAKVSNLLARHTLLLVLLSVIDGARSFMTGGSSYLWKDLFHQVGDCGPQLNLLASLAPLVGLALCHFCSDFFKVGSRKIAFACSVLASIGLCLLTQTRVQDRMWPLLTCIMIVKLTYGPLVTVVSLMKAEVFPTEVRATAFSLISVVAKFACMVAPSLLEEMKGRGWTHPHMMTYLLILSGNSFACGMLSLWVPEGIDSMHLRKAGDSESAHFLDSDGLRTDEAGRTMQTDAMGRTYSVEVANIWDDSDSQLSNAE